MTLRKKMKGYFFFTKKAEVVQTRIMPRLMMMVVTLVCVPEKREPHTGGLECTEMTDAA